MKIVSFGEILFDVFGNEKKIGGAPFNFAAHAARLGAESYLVSAVGADENGREALAAAANVGVRTDLISVERNYPTGRCDVSLSGGKPVYSLVQNVAYDHIRPNIPPFKADALYMGTLAMRSGDSARSFESILRSLERKEVFFDVNLRQNYYSRALVERLTACATILKISDEELPVYGRGDDVSVLLSISSRFKNLKYICLTMGAKGAAVFDCANKAILFSDTPKNKPVSTVGAGDSFSAAFLYFLLSGEPIGVCLDNAVKLSDFVVTRLEAVPDYGKAEIFG